MFLTQKILKSAGIPREQTNLFRAKYPRGVLLTLEACNILSNLPLDLELVGQELFSESITGEKRWVAWKKYMNNTSPALHSYGDTVAEPRRIHTFNERYKIKYIEDVAFNLYDQVCSEMWKIYLQDILDVEKDKEYQAQKLFSLCLQKDIPNSINVILTSYWAIIGLFH